MCRSRCELSNAYILATFCFDTAENEPCEVQMVRSLAYRTFQLSLGQEGLRIADLALHFHVGVHDDREEHVEHDPQNEHLSFF